MLKERNLYSIWHVGVCLSSQYILLYLLHKVEGYTNII